MSSQEQSGLACAEIWGGNERTTRTVELPGLDVWIYSNPMEADAGGDLYYLSVCAHGVLSRIAMADVSGHGTAVEAPARTLHRLMREHINAWDQTEFVCELNLLFRGSASEGKYATAVVLGYRADTGELAFTNAGHLPPLWRRNDRSWEVLEERSGQAGLSGLPVGLIATTGYRQTAVTLNVADTIVLYTDGITESTDSIGNELGIGSLRHWLESTPANSPAEMGQALLERLGAFRQDRRVDDETLMVIHRTA